MKKSIQIIQYNKIIFDFEIDSEIKIILILNKLLL